MPTYIEIHPFWYDSVTVSNEMFSENKRPQKEYYHPAEPQVIRIDTIKRIKKEYISDDSIDLKRLVISDDYHDDIIVSAEEAESIKAKLLFPSRQDGLAKQIEGLTVAIRELRDLLRARLG